MTTRYAEEMVNKLQALGSSDQIALYYEGRGIKAETCHSMACVVAVDALETYGFKASVTPTSLWIQKDSDYAYGAETDDVEFERNSPLGEFISRFDHGDFPNLISVSRSQASPLYWVLGLD